MTPRLAYTIAEAAAASGISEATIRKAINATENYLPARLVGRKKLILIGDLEQWLESLPRA